VQCANRSARRAWLVVAFGCSDATLDSALTYSSSLEAHNGPPLTGGARTQNSTKVRERWRRPRPVQRRVL
jgi:hypothetical protein